MNDEDDDDIYAQHLKEAFQSCDLNDKGYLNRNELIDLSQKLQLNDQIPALLKELLNGEFNEGKVTCEAFKDALVNVLTNTLELDADTTEEDQSEWSETGEVFSRSSSVLSKYDPDREESFDNLLHKQTAHIKDEFLVRKSSTPKLEHSKKKKRTQPFRLPSKDEMVIEGNGNMEPIPMRTLASTTPEIPSNMDAQQLRKVWDDFAVGESGFLNLLQLSTVCDYIGMGNLEDEDLELLFNELDTDRDGFVSFKEFYTGLFSQKNDTDALDGLDSEQGQEDDDDDIDSTRSICSIKSLKEIVRDEGSVLSVGKQNGNVERPTKTSAVDLLSFLDVNDSGYLELGKMKSYFAEQDIGGLEQLLTEKRTSQDVGVKKQELQPNSEGKIRLKEFSHLLERSVYESNERKKELLKTLTSKIRNELDTSKQEVTVLKSTVSQLGDDKKNLIKESEDQNKQIEMKSKTKLKHIQDKFERKLSLQEEGLIKQRDSMLEKHQNEKVLLHEEMEKMKNDDIKTKTKLKETTTEVLRLEENLKLTINQLNEERKKRSAFEKESHSKSDAHKKISNLEREVKNLTKIRDSQVQKIENLETVNKELRDECDELHHLHNNVKSNHFQDVSTNRHGSYLSDYVKPDIIKRKSQSGGESSDEVFSNADMDELRIKVINQETTILSLQRDLDNVNRQLEESTTQSNERQRREVKRITDNYTFEITELQKRLTVERDEIVNHYSKEKSSLIESYEQKIDELKKSYTNENDNLKRNYENERDRWELSSDGDNSRDLSFKKERRKIEQSFRDEKEEIELNYRSEITKLEEKVVILETEKAEMELKFLNEKAELEQRFRIERAELQQNATTTSREFEKSQKHIDLLKDELTSKYEHEIAEIKRGHRLEKETMLDNMENEIEEINKKHQREMNELKRMYTQQVSDMEKKTTQEYTSLREGLTRGKTELEERYSREKTQIIDSMRQEYEHDLTVQLSELRKTLVEERSASEEDLRQEKCTLTMSLEHEKASSERQLKQLKTEMEITFAEERTRMREDFEMEKTLLENKYTREISDLQQALSGGEACLKGKIKDDFNNMLEKYKREWEMSLRKEKLQLQESYAREKAELELSWQVEKAAMEENFETIKFEMEEEGEKEKQDITSKFHKQKQRLEDEFHVELRKLKTNRDEEFHSRVQRETEHLQASVNHLEVELTSLREQKKELETQNQILELKVLSQKQEAKEMSEYHKEKQMMGKQLNEFSTEITGLKDEIKNLENLLESERHEKSTILDNSVQEITDKEDEISTLKNEISTLLERNDELKLKLNKFELIENENSNLKHDLDNLLQQNTAQNEMIKVLKQVEEDNQVLNENVRSLESQENILQSSLREKDLHITRSQDDIQYYKNKLENLENTYKNEIESFNEKLNMQSAAFTTEKSRYHRELQELKDHLHRANLSSDRDNALKEKVFNDAKAEVMNLNKKLDEKSRKIRSLEETLKTFETKLNATTDQRDAYEREIQNVKSMMNENNCKAREEKKEITTNSMRSNVLVTDLYVENADLMKQLANAETNLTTSEKQVRQLTDQKRALQRVISKLCHANGITLRN